MRGSTRSRIRVAACGALCLIACSAASAHAARPLQLGISDNAEFQAAEAERRAEWLDRTKRAGAGVVALAVSWRAVAPAKRPAGFAPRDPASPGYSWSSFDTAVRDVAARGLAPFVLVTSAPGWAEGAGRPGNAAPGTWKPEPQALGDFATAIATRYSGSYSDPGEGSLPRVSRWQLWAEPNLSTYLTPQWKGRKPVAPRHYRSMLNAFYRGVKGVNRRNVVVTGGTAPYGDSPGGARMRPLKFWREVLCLRRKGRGLAGKKCPVKPRFDVLAHHPINTSGGPRRSALHRDDASTPDFGRVRQTLRAAERARKIAGGRKRRQLWATELWWESNPPDGFRGVPLQRHARYIEEALYILWKQGARLVVNFQIRDAAYDPQHPLDTLQTGLYFRDGSPKPALTAFRFPFVTERRSGRKVRAWGRAPAGGTLRIERKAGRGWRTVKRLKVGRGKVFSTTLRLGGKQRLRARVGGETSLVWAQGR